MRRRSAQWRRRWPAPRGGRGCSFPTAPPARLYTSTQIPSTAYPMKDVGHQSATEGTASSPGTAVRVVAWSKISGQIGQVGCNPTQLVGSGAGLSASKLRGRGSAWQGAAVGSFLPPDSQRPTALAEARAVGLLLLGRHAPVTSRLWPPPSWCAPVPSAGGRGCRRRNRTPGRRCGP